MNDNIVTITGLTIRFGSHRVFQGLSTAFRRGESVLIAGRNGVGKSTLLRLMAGILLPISGTVSLAPGLTRNKVGIITDWISLFEDFSLKQGIDFHCRVFGIDDYNFQLINMLKLNLGSKIKKLSAGERVIYHLSLVLAQNPDIILIDEVLHAIDPYLRDLALDAVIDLIDERQATVITVNQTFSDIERIPERILILEDGLFILDEKRENLNARIKKVIGKERPDDGIPVIFEKPLLDDYSEYTIYPFSTGAFDNSAFEVVDISLTEMIKAFIGGYYVKKRV